MVLRTGSSSRNGHDKTKRGGERLPPAGADVLNRKNGRRHGLGENASESRREEDDRSNVCEREERERTTLQRQHDERFEREYEPMLGPYAIACDDRRYRRRLCLDCPTCTKQKAPLYAIHNKYILSGYRTKNTFLDALRSVFKKHNETANIWTHLIGVLFFFVCLINVKEPERIQMIPETWVTGASAERVLGLQMTQKWREKVKIADVALIKARKSLLVGGGGEEKGEDKIDENNNKNNNEVLERSIDSLLSASKTLRNHLLEESGRSFADVKAETAMFIKEAKISLKKSRTSVDVDNKNNHGSADGEKEQQSVMMISKVNAALRDVQDVLDEIPKDVERLNKVPRWPMRLFLLGAISCLGCSTCCHTCCNISEQVSRQMWKVDYLGIAILIVASFYPVIYYSFYCLPELRDFYLLCITILGVTTLIPTVLPKFQKPSWTPIRAMLFVSLASFGVFPWFHNVFFVWKVVPTPIWHGFFLEIAMGVAYISGAFCYAMKIPEKYWPGRFDVFGCGHNIFHILVVCGALLHYEACLVLELWRDHHTCEADEVLMRDSLVYGEYFGFKNFNLFDAVLVWKSKLLG